MKYILVFLFLVTGFRSQDDEKISWATETKLSWYDFKGKPTNDRAAAITASGITYQFSTSGSRDAFEIDFEVNTHFYPLKSWYQPHMVDSIILGHEQLHFDISELYARKMRKRLADTQFTQNVKAEVKEIYREINLELNDFQNRYDDETNFSRNYDNQLLWNEKIERLLVSED